MSSRAPKEAWPCLPAGRDPVESTGLLRRFIIHHNIIRGFAPRNDGQWVSFTKLVYFVFLLFFLFPVITIFAAPDEEREPSSNGAPLDVLSSQATEVLVPQSGDFENRYIIAAVGSGINLVDTETWSLTTEEPADFGATIGGIALLSNGTSLVVTLSDGDIARIALDDLANENSNVEDAEDDDADDPRVVDLSEQTEDGTLGGIVADPDAGDQIVYFINTDDNLLFSYDFSSESLTEIELDETPNDLVFADSDSGQKIYVCSASGSVFVLSAGGSSVSMVAVPTRGGDTADPNLAEIAVTPNGDYIYVVDSTNTLVWVLDTSSDSFIDQQSGGTSKDPIVIESDENTGISNIHLTTVTSPDSVYGYVSGEDGLTILNASSPTSAPASPKIVDMDDSTGDVLDPLALSGTPGPIAASTYSDGYVYTSNGNGENSVITDNPFITIDSSTSITLDGTNTTFSVTFQSDEAGTYDVRINSNITGSSGTELISSTTLSDGEVDTDVTTATVDMNDYSRTVFEEGTNRVFIYLADSDGNEGRDAVDITVDRPPQAVTITDTNFGNERAYAVFNKLTDSDINQYQLVAKRAESQVSPSCPGSLDFTAEPRGVGTKNHDDCDDSCTGNVSGLTNGIVYCVAVRAQDDGGQWGEFGTSDEPVTPERTVGPAGLLGETGCSLQRSLVTSHWSLVLLFVLKLFLLIVCRGAIYGALNLGRDKSRPYIIFFIILILGTFCFPKPASAQVTEVDLTSGDASPLKPEFKWFSLELKGSFWIPMNSTVESFFGKCCNLTGEAEFGLLYKDRYNATVAIGFMSESGNAVGVGSGAVSGDRFNLLLIPIRNNFIYRLDFKEEQVVVPYVGAGLDYVFFRENVQGDTTKGWKFGIHGMGGFAFLLDRIEDIGSSMREMGIDDVYFTIEGRYSKIDSFKSTGLDLSGINLYFGFLLAF